MSEERATYDGEPVGLVDHGASVLSLWRYLTGEDVHEVPAGKHPCGRAIGVIKGLKAQVAALEMDKTCLGITIGAMVLSNGGSLTFTEKDLREADGKRLSICSDPATGMRTVTLQSRSAEAETELNGE